MRLHDFFDFHVREHPAYPLAIHRERTISYGNASPQVNRLANALVDSGLEKGDRIGILSRNSIEYLLLYLAASKSGVVPVPMNYRLAPAEWLHILRDSGTRLLFAEDIYCADVEQIRDELGQVAGFISCGGEVSGWTRLEDWSRSSSEDRLDQLISSQDDCFQMYTSGTTGLPKGALLTHSNVTMNSFQVSQAIAEFGPGDTNLLVAPVYHVAAAIAFFSTMLRGGCLYLQEKFEAERVVKALSEGGLVGALLVPSMIQTCLTDVEDVFDRDYERLRVITYGASAISEQTLRDALRAFGCDFVQGYGMTETSAVITLLSQEDHRRALRDCPELLSSAGRPVMGTELCIVDDNGQPVPQGEVGQILARGPQVMRGYWGMPEATEEALAGGWMHTGDAGRLDEEGYLYIMDRVKDMIISGAENIYPRAIEDVLFAHPDVSDVAVIGVPDERWGETVKAVVVLRENRKEDPEGLIQFCRQRLGGFQVPRSIDFIDEIPRNPSGKVLKRVLREPYWANHNRNIS